jgi:hypothetical protein
VEEQTVRWEKNQDCEVSMVKTEKYSKRRASSTG